MLEYKENYGEDADGNRGMMMTFYELEESDNDEVISQIAEYVQKTSEEPSNPFTIHMTSYEGNDVELEIDPRDYTTFYQCNSCEGVIEESMLNGESYINCPNCEGYLTDTKEL